MDINILCVRVGTLHARQARNALSVTCFSMSYNTLWARFKKRTKTKRLENTEWRMLCLS